MSRLLLDPADFAGVIDTAVEAMAQRLESTRPTDSAGHILMSKRQAAAALGVSEATVDRWRAEAALPFVKIDGKVLFRPASLDEWAKARESGAIFESIDKQQGGAGHE